MNQEQFDQKAAIEKLIALMAMLRDKEYGCPWDLEQSIASLVPYTLEEVYEVVDAIENEDMADLQGELGDLLFQVVFYARIAQEAGLFDFDDIANAITRKLVRRHPHVFPDGDVGKFGSKPDISSAQVVVNWEAIKQEEKQERGTLESHSLLDDVPQALPALERARKLQKRAARAGFDWTAIEPVIAKLKEEVAELEAALAQDDPERVSDELGDVLFAAVNLARHADVEPESALRASNRRFENRFRWIESTLREQGKALQESSLEELDQLWEQAKTTGL